MTGASSPANIEELQDHLAKLGVTLFGFDASVENVKDTWKQIVPLCSTLGKLDELLQKCKPKDTPLPVGDTNQNAQPWMQDFNRLDIKVEEIRKSHISSSRKTSSVNAREAQRRHQNSLSEIKSIGDKLLEVLQDVANKRNPPASPSSRLYTPYLL